MYLKSNIEKEQFYWDKQIERHHIGKRIRKLARKINYKPYKKLSLEFEVSPKTIWAIANGLASVSVDFLEKLERLEKSK